VWFKCSSSNSKVWLTTVYRTHSELYYYRSQEDISLLYEAYCLRQQTLDIIAIKYIKMKFDNKYAMASWLYLCGWINHVILVDSRWRIGMTANPLATYTSALRVSVTINLCTINVDYYHSDTLFQSSSFPHNVNKHVFKFYFLMLIQILRREMVRVKSSERWAYNNWASIMYPCNISIPFI
jgi:hypothetical protein